MDEWLTLRARTHPEHPAIVAQDGATTSYAELDRLAASMARRLAALGVGAGDRVATTLPAGADFAGLLHAVAKLGAILVPLDPRLTTSERHWRIDDSGASAVIDSPLDGEEADVELRSRLRPDDPYTLIYTSGTTAHAKGVMLTHENHHTSAIACASNLDVAADDRWLCVLPVHHVGGLAILVRSAIYATTAIMHARFDEQRTAAALADADVTLVSLVPTMVRRLIEAGRETPPTLRAALVGGGPIPSALLEWAGTRGFPLVASYGMTETASLIAACTAQEALARGGAAGRPLDGVDLRIGAGREILVRGPMVARSALSADGWLHSGDTGELDEDGYLRVCGRLADVIVSGGENIACAEVEAALLAHPAVVDAAVVGQPDPEWGEAVIAYVELNEATSGDELIAFCRARLSNFKLPKSVHTLDKLPRGATGKLVRSDLIRSNLRG